MFFKNIKIGLKKNYTSSKVRTISNNPNLVSQIDIQTFSEILKKLLLRVFLIRRQTFREKHVVENAAQLFSLFGAPNCKVSLSLKELLENSSSWSAKNFYCHKMVINTILMVMNSIFEIR